VAFVFSFVEYGRSIFIKKVFVYELVFPIDERKIFFFLYKIPRINFSRLY